MSAKLHWRLIGELESTLTGSSFTLQLDRPNNSFLTTELLNYIYQQVILESNKLCQTVQVASSRDYLLPRATLQ